MYTIQISGLLGESEQWLKSLSKEEISKYLSNHFNSMYMLTNLQEAKQDAVVKQEAKQEAVDKQAIKLDYKSKADIAASTTLGQYGEFEMANICAKLPSCYSLKDTTKQGKTGDFILEYMGPTRVFRCLIDCKNYRSTIPTKEITKFYDDLTYGNYDLGLLISYNTKFVGYNNHIHVENKHLPHGEIPVMFLAIVPVDIVNKCIEMLFMYVETKYYKCPTDKVYGCCVYINNTLNQMASVRRALSEMQTSMQTSIQKCQEQILTFEVQIKHAITEMTRVNPTLIKLSDDKPTKPTDLTPTKFYDDKLVIQSEELKCLDDNAQQLMLSSYKSKRKLALLNTTLNYNWYKKTYDLTKFVLMENVFTLTIMYKTRVLMANVKSLSGKLPSCICDSAELNEPLAELSDKLNVYFATKITSEI